jgi:hypothetical protein
MDHFRFPMPLAQCLHIRPLKTLGCMGRPFSWKITESIMEIPGISGRWRMLCRPHLLQAIYQNSFHNTGIIAMIDVPMHESLAGELAIPRCSCMNTAVSKCSRWIQGGGFSGTGIREPVTLEYFRAKGCPHVISAIRT